jgi:hypothetical protein
MKMLEGCNHECQIKTTYRHKGCGECFTAGNVRAGQTNRSNEHCGQDEILPCFGRERGCH